MHKTEKNIASLIKELRTRKNLSLRTLASHTGFSASFLSQIENGQVSPSISSLEKIAAAFDLTLAEFFSRATSERLHITRADQREELISEWSKAKIASLGFLENTRFSITLLTLDSQGQSGRSPSISQGERFALVFEGNVSLSTNDEIYHLKRGDAVTFAADIPHRWSNEGPTASQVVIVSSNKKGLQ